MQLHNLHSRKLFFEIPAFCTYMHVPLDKNHLARAERIVKSGAQFFVCDALLSETVGAWVHDNEETRTLWIPEMNFSYLQNMQIFFQSGK